MTPKQAALECVEIARLEQAEVERLRAELAAAQPTNPCTCVPDGDDGTVAHLCGWHAQQFGKAYRMQNIADTLTVENILRLPQDALRRWIAHGIQESTARKKAEEQLETAQQALAEQQEQGGMVMVPRAALARWLEALIFEQGGEPIGTYTANAISELKAMLSAAPNASGLDMARLLRFSGLMLDQHRDGMGDVDGASIQEWALECGLLETRTVMGPCGDNCDCADINGDFPCECHFASALGESAIDAARKGRG